MEGPAAIQAMALNPGAYQYTGHAFSSKACFMVAGDLTTNVNERSTYLDVYGETQFSQLRLVQTDCVKRGKIEQTGNNLN